MNKKETIVAISVIIMAIALTIGVLVLSPSPKVNNRTATNNSTTQDIGAIVDLTSQNEITMNIKDYKYEKPNIKIKKGTTITWTNQDTIQHNVMLEHEGAGKAHDAPTKEQVDPNELAGPLLAKGESYSFTFNELTANPYHCSPHPYMKGSVTVVE